MGVGNYKNAALETSILRQLWHYFTKVQVEQNRLKTWIKQDHRCVTDDDATRRSHRGT